MKLTCSGIAPNSAPITLEEGKCPLTGRLHTTTFFGKCKRHGIRVCQMLFWAMFAKIPGNRPTLERALVAELFRSGAGENPRAKRLMQRLTPRGSLALVPANPPATNSNETLWPVIGCSCDPGMPPDPVAPKHHGNPPRPEVRPYNP